MSESKGTQQDALALLKSDHEKVKKAFEKYQELGERALAEKKKLADDICSDLIAHTQIEEEIFYPRFRKEAEDPETITDEALVEHNAAKELITQIQAMDSDDKLFDATVQVLSEQIIHHVKEEEEEMFPKMKKTDVDLVALGEKLAARKAELLKK